MWSAAKNWLKKSGIHREGNEIIDSLNPLDAIIEDEDFPMARVYRESFWTGIKDTYNVLLGDHYTVHGGRKGVLDILIFPIISRRIVYYIFRLEQKLYTSRFIDPPKYQEILFYLISTIGLIVSFPIELLRALLGLTLTLILSPIVAIAHIFAYFKVKSLMDSISKLPIKQEKVGPLVDKIDLNMIRGGDYYIDPTLVTEESKFDQSKSTKYVLSILFYGKGKLSASEMEFPFNTIRYIEVTPENESGIMSLLSMNSFSMLYRLRRDGGILMNIISQLQSYRLSREAFVDGMSKCSDNKSSIKELIQPPLFDRRLVKLIFAYAGCGTAEQTNFAEEISPSEKRKEVVVHHPKGIFQPSP